MLPDWAPNLHPLVVHFPISLLVAAAIVDVVGLFRQASYGLRIGAVVLYAAGALGALASYITGNRAAESVSVPTEAISALNTHQDLALYTLLFFAAYAAARIALLLLRRDPAPLLRTTFAVIGIAGQMLVWQTAEYGGRLVFDYGVGVAAVTEMDGELQMLRRRHQAAEAAPITLEGGGVRWTIGPGADVALTEFFRFVDGSAEDLRLSVAEGDEGAVLALEMVGDAVMLVAGDDLNGVDAEIELDASDFEGSVALVHNVASPQSYHYLRLDGEAAELGRIVEGRDERMARELLAHDTLEGSTAAEDRPINEERWKTLRATGDQGHFYGYVDGATIGHGHSAHPSPGPAGVRIEGEGTLRLRRIEVRPVE